VIFSDRLCAPRPTGVSRAGFVAEKNKLYLLMQIEIINGPNLNLLGKREPEKYGNSSFEDYLGILKTRFPDIRFKYYQSNTEGDIINEIHNSGFSFDGIILNAGGYTHTSVAIADAIAAVSTSVIEVHITNISAREEFRHTSLIGRSCAGSISGFGLDSYRLAVESLIEIKKSKKK
jgi:3-dehydroquinate dehydratase-2